MVSRRFFLTACLVLGRFSVMAGCMFMVFRRFFVVFCTMFAHCMFWKVEFKETDAQEGNNDNRRLSNLQAPEQIYHRSSLTL
jgi:hypothetical protein